MLLVIHKVVGQFITQETPLLTFYEKKEPLQDEERNRLLKSFLLGHERTETQDFSFSILKIEEIALKALSGGMNDPNTALHCIKYLGLLLRDLAAINKGYLLFRSDNGEVYLEAQNFEILLVNSYHQLVHYGQSDPFVMGEIFKSLRYAKGGANTKNKGIIQNYADALFKRLMTEETYDTIEKQWIEKEYEHVKSI